MKHLTMGYQVMVQPEFLIRSWVMSDYQVIRLGRMSLASIHYKMEVKHPEYVSSSRSKGLMKAAQIRQLRIPCYLSLLPWQPPLSLYQWPFDGHCDELLSYLMEGSMPHLLKVL